MTVCNCNRKCSCTAVAVIASLILGVIAAFLQITAVITVAPVFLWVTLGIAVVYLGVLVVAAALSGSRERCRCVCAALNALLIGLLGTIFFSVLLLAVGIVATSVLSAILVGLLTAFFTLTVTATACLIRCLTGCEN